MKDQITNWIINNIKNPYSPPVLSNAVPFAIWQRQWEVCDLTAARNCARKLADRVAGLAANEKSYQSEAYFYKSVVASNDSDFSSALYLARQGLEKGVNEGDYRKKAQLLGQCGKCCYNMGDFTGALEYWQEVLNISVSRSLEDLRGVSCNSIGMIYWKTARYQDALDILTQAEQSYQNQQNLRSCALTLQSLGNVLLGVDRTEEALEYYSRSRDLAKKIGDLSLQSVLLNNIGSIHFRKGHQSMAREAYERGLEIDRMLGNISGQAKKMNNLAILLAIQGKQKMALDYILKALEMDISTGNRDGQMAKMGNISSMYLDLGEIEKAWDYLEQGINLARNIGNQGFLGQFLGLRVNIYLKQGRPDEAIKAGEESLEINRRIGNRSYQVRALINMHGVYLSIKQPQKALECSAQSLALIETDELFEAEKESVYFAHYQSLVACGQNKESIPFLEASYRELMHQAEGIKDNEGMEFFLHGDALHHQILTEWENLQKTVGQG